MHAWSLSPCTPPPSMASPQLRPQREDKELPQWQHHSPRGTVREPKETHSVYALSEAARPLAEAGDVRRRLSRHVVTACPHKTFPIAVRTPCQLHVQGWAALAQNPFLPSFLKGGPLRPQLPTDTATHLHLPNHGVLRLPPSRERRTGPHTGQR